MAAAVTAAAAIGIIAFSSLGGHSPSKPVHGHALAGTFTLFGPKVQQDPCAHQNLVSAGAPVGVIDEHGSAIGSATLSGGSADPTRRACVYHFNVPSLPDAGTYTIDVGHLGGLKYTFADLTKTGWKVGLNLGVPK